MLWTKISFSFGPRFFVAINIFFAVAILALSLFSYLYTLKDVGWQSLKFCLRSECVEQFEIIFSGPIKIVKSGLIFLGLSVSGSGVIVALMTYRLSVKSAALSGYIGHLNLFRSYMDGELKGCPNISVASIDSYKWYDLMFPDAPLGRVFVSKNYVRLVVSVKRELETTSALLSASGQKTRYDYKEHQSRLINALLPFGINITRMPRNNFFEAESQIVGLIDSINRTFSRGSGFFLPMLGDVRRPYL